MNFLIQSIFVLFSFVLSQAAFASDDNIPALLPESALQQVSVAQNVDDALTLAEAEAIAVKDNPGLASMASRAKAFAEIPPQVGSLPDPHIKFDAVNFPTDSFSTKRETMTQFRIGLSQEIPFPGKLKAKEDAAQFEALSASYDVVETRLRLVRNVNISWWNLFYLDRALEIVTRNQALLRQFIRIAETKYTVGEGLQQDVLLAQVELSKLLDVEIRLVGARKNEVSRLNALLNRPTYSPIHLPKQVEEQLPQLPTEPELHQIAVQQRPLLASQGERINAAKKRVDLAQLDYYPDFKVGTMWGTRNNINPATGQARPDLASLGISFNLPIFTSTKQDRALGQQQANVERERYALQDATEAVWSETSTSLADFIKTRDQASLFKTGIIPQASQTVDSMLAGYQVNKVDFLNLVQSQVTLYNYETLYWRALTGARQSLARLEAAIGKKIVKEITHE
ncbi:MAG: TolC family protein [Mariprofundus sp.]|nr:TolC family protein [Mariprofundus sp.]